MPGSTKPTTASLLTERDRELVKELRNGGKSWVVRAAPWLAFVLSLGVILGAFKMAGDERYVNAEEAATAQRANDVTHTAIKDDCGKKVHAIVEALDKEILLRSMQGKDVETNSRDIARLERRRRISEDRGQ